MNSNKVRSIKLFSELYDELQDAPDEVKKSYNELVKYFAISTPKDPVKLRKVNPKVYTETIMNHLMMPKGDKYVLNYRPAVFLRDYVDPEILKVDKGSDEYYKYVSEGINKLLDDYGPITSKSSKEIHDELEGIKVILDKIVK